MRTEKQIHWRNERRMEDWTKGKKEERKRDCSVEEGRNEGRKRGGKENVTAVLEEERRENEVRKGGRRACSVGRLHLKLSSVKANLARTSTLHHCSIKENEQHITTTPENFVKEWHDNTGRKMRLMMFLNGPRRIVRRKGGGS